MKTAIKAAESMNGKFFAGRKLEVRVARYGWSNRMRREVKEGSLRKLIPVGSHAKQDPLPKGRQNPVRSRVTDGVSFAQVVKGVEGDIDDCIIIPKEVIDNNVSWLSNNLVGIVRCNELIPSSPGICELGGIRDVKLSRMGGEKLLISFPNLEVVSSALGQSYSFWNKAFASLQKWVLGFSVTKREVWIQ